MSRTSLGALLVLCCVFVVSSDAFVNPSQTQNLLRHNARTLFEGLTKLHDLGRSLSDSAANAHQRLSDHFATQSAGLSIACQASLATLLLPLLAPNGSCVGLFANVMAVSMSPSDANVTAFCNHTCMPAFQQAMANISMTCDPTNFAADLTTAAGVNPALAALVAAGVDIRNFAFVAKGICAKGPEGNYCYPIFFSTSMYIVAGFQITAARGNGMAPDPSVTAQAMAFAPFMPNSTNLPMICRPCWFKLLSFYADYAFRSKKPDLEGFFSAANTVCLKERNVWCYLEASDPAAMPTANVTLDIPRLPRICATRCFLRLIAIQAKNARMMMTASPSDPHIAHSLVLVNAARAAYRFVCARNRGNFCFRIYGFLSNNFYGMLPAPIGSCNGPCLTGTAILQACLSASANPPTCTVDCSNAIRTYFATPAGCCFGAAVRFLNDSAVQNQTTDPNAALMVKTLLTCQAAAQLDIRPCVGPTVSVTYSMPNLNGNYTQNNAPGVAMDAARDLADSLGNDPPQNMVTVSGFAVANMSGVFGTTLRATISSDSPAEALSLTDVMNADAMSSAPPFPTISGYDQSAASNNDLQSVTYVDPSYSTSSCTGNCTVPPEDPLPGTTSSSSTGGSSSSSTGSTNDASSRRSSLSFVVLALSALAFIFA